MAKRPDGEIARAIDRLRHEDQVLLAELAGEPIELCGETLTPSAAVLLRWGQSGRGGVYLDVLFCRAKAAWVTSGAAVERFRAAVAARATAQREAG